eukprot:936926_1
MPEINGFILSEDDDDCVMNDMPTFTPMGDVVREFSAHLPPPEPMCDVVREFSANLPPPEFDSSDNYISDEYTTAFKSFSKEFTLATEAFNPSMSVKSFTTAFNPSMSVKSCLEDAPCMNAIQEGMMSLSGQSIDSELCSEICEIILTFSRHALNQLYNHSIGLFASIASERASNKTELTKTIVTSERYKTVHHNVTPYVQRSNKLKRRSRLGDFETPVSKYDKQWQKQRADKAKNTTLKYCTDTDKEWQKALDMRWKDGEYSESKICRAVWNNTNNAQKRKKKQSVHDIHREGGWLHDPKIIALLRERDEKEKRKAERQKKKMNKKQRKKKRNKNNNK